MLDGGYCTGSFTIQDMCYSCVVSKMSSDLAPSAVRREGGWFALFLHWPLTYSQLMLNIVYESLHKG